MRTKIMAVAFDNVTMEEAVAAAMEHIQAKTKCMVVTPNAEIAQNCKTDHRLSKIVSRAGLVLPDGIGVIYASRILKKPLKQKVAGVEFAENLMKALAKTEYSVFFLGGKPGVAETAAQKLTAKYPGLHIAGTKDGYFKEEAEAVKAVQQAAPDVLFVCLGSPKQEYFMDRYLDELPASLMAGLGGSLDVFAGVAERAPEFFIKFGLEWFYRLLKQPQRIGRMMKLPLYLIEAFKAKGEK